MAGIKRDFGVRLIAIGAIVASTVAGVASGSGAAVISVPGVKQGIYGPYGGTTVATSGENAAADTLAIATTGCSSALVAVSLTGCSGGVVAVSGTDSATGTAAISGTGRSTGDASISGLGDSAGGAAAASGTGDATGGSATVSLTDDSSSCANCLASAAVSGTGDATGNVNNGGAAASGTGTATGDETVVSGSCDAQAVNGPGGGSSTVGDTSVTQYQRVEGAELTGIRQCTSSDPTDGVTGQVGAGAQMVEALVVWAQAQPTSVDPSTVTATAGNLVVWALGQVPPVDPGAILAMAQQAVADATGSLPSDIGPVVSQSEAVLQQLASAVSGILATAPTIATDLAASLVEGDTESLLAGYRVPGDDGDPSNDGPALGPDELETSDDPTTLLLDEIEGTAAPLLPSAPAIVGGVSTVDVVPGGWTPEATACPPSQILLGARASCRIVVPNSPALNRPAFLDYVRAHARWGTWNPRYQRFPDEYSNDCTDFVSQALYAGGWAESFGSATSNTSWWWDDDPHSWQHKQSYSWGGAQNLFDFAKESGRRSRVYNWQDVSVGDIISVKYPPGGYLNGERIGHTMVVTGFDSRGILVSYHSVTPNGQLDIPLNDFKAAITADYGPGAKYFVWRPK